MRLERIGSGVVLGEDEIKAIVERNAHNRLVIDELRSRLREHADLLMSALVDLATETGAKDRQHFVRQWLREHRFEDQGGVPIVRR